MSKFVKESLSIEVGVKKAYRIKIKDNKEVVVASLESWDQKREIMSRKKNLRQGIWIEDDLTKEREREKASFLCALGQVPSSAKNNTEQKSNFTMITNS